MVWLGRMLCSYIQMIEFEQTQQKIECWDPGKVNWVKYTELLTILWMSKNLSDRSKYLLCPTPKSCSSFTDRIRLES